LAKNIAMQIAAANPVCLAPEDLPQDLVEKEKEIFKNQAMAEGKPEHIAEKIIEGRLKKYYKEVCLLEQPYIRDDKMTVQDLVGEAVAVLGENIQLGRFTRMALGDEG
ncbi:MAG: elongation factor Ts, partial [Thermodesulfobacteriota bacterium]|nr:elongation factor Ts [Thermodesulfobacteriota bacterium]